MPDDGKQRRPPRFSELPDDWEPGDGPAMIDDSDVPDYGETVVDDIVQPPPELPLP